VHLAAGVGGGGRAGRDGHGHADRGGVEPGVRERAERFGQGDDFGGQVQARRGLRHRPFETEPGSGFGECALVAGLAVVGGVDQLV